MSVGELEGFLNAVLLTDAQHLEALAWLAFATLWFGAAAAGALVLLAKDVVER